jgi:LacI family transcriptional regulator
VAYVSGEPALVPIQQRYSDFRRQAARHHFDTDPNLVVTAPLNSAGGYDATRRLWAAVERKPTAIVALSDTVAMGVLRFLLDEKIQVPAEVSLISFDGVAASEFTHPSITTVATPLYEIGQQAFQLFLGAIGHRYTGPQNVILPVKLIPRESVGVARKERTG